MAIAPFREIETNIARIRTSLCYAHWFCCRNYSYCSHPITKAFKTFKPLVLLHNVHDMDTLRMRYYDACLSLRLTDVTQGTCTVLCTYTTCEMRHTVSSDDRNACCKKFVGTLRKQAPIYEM